MRPPSFFWQMVRFGGPYFVAALVGSVICTLGFWWEETSSLFRYPNHPPQWVGHVFSGWFVGIFVGLMTALIATPLVLAAIFVIRRIALWRPLADIVAGMFLGLAATFQSIEARLEIASRASATGAADSVYQLLVGIGFGGAAGGLTYWLLAGRPRPPYFVMAPRPPSPPG